MSRERIVHSVKRGIKLVFTHLLKSYCTYCPRASGPMTRCSTVAPPLTTSTHSPSLLATACFTLSSQRPRKSARGPIAAAVFTPPFRGAVTLVVGTRGTLELLVDSEVACQQKDLRSEHHSIAPMHHRAAANRDPLAPSMPWSPPYLGNIAIGGLFLLGKHLVVPYVMLGIRRFRTFGARAWASSPRDGFPRSHSRLASIS